MNQEARYIELKANRVDNFGRIYLDQITRSLLKAETATILVMKWDRIKNQLIVTNPDLENVCAKD